MTKIIDRYLEIKNTKVTDKTDILIKECFKFGVFKTKPSLSHKKWFKECFNNDYPTDIKELNKTLIKELNKTVTTRKEDAELKEKWREQRAKNGFSDSDSWNINYWFLEIMPKILKRFRNNLHGYPDSIVSYPKTSQSVIMNKKDKPEGLTKWERTLDRMIFLLGEMNEETCTFKNPYEKEYDKINNIFHEKYGFFGEGLKTPEQLEKEKKEKATTMLSPYDFPDMYPDYKELQSDYYRVERDKDYYRDRCREEFFNLFSQHFWDLWD